MGCFPLYITYGWYIGSTWMSSSTRSPLNSRNNYSSMFACMKGPGMSQVITLQFSFVSIMLDRKKDSTQTVSELVSSFDLYNRCFLPSAHPHPFTLLHQSSKFDALQWFHEIICNHSVCRAIGQAHFSSSNVVSSKIVSDLNVSSLLATQYLPIVLKQHGTLVVLMDYIVHHLETLTFKE